MYRKQVRFEPESVRFPIVFIACQKVIFSIYKEQYRQFLWHRAVLFCAEMKIVGSIFGIQPTEAQYNKNLSIWHVFLTNYNVNLQSK